jgi:hypothetical protein
MKRTIITLLLLFTATWGDGQSFSYKKVPGYLGRRLLFGYEVVFHPVPKRPLVDVGFNAINYSNSKTGGYFTDNFFFDGRHTLVLDWVASLRQSFGIYVGRLRTGFTTSQYVQRPFGQPSYNENFYFRLQGTEIGITAKSFFNGTNGTPAPFGNYFKVRAGILSGKILYATFPGTIRRDVFFDTFSGFVASIGFGKQSFIANRIGLNYGVELGFFSPTSNFIESGEKLKGAYYQGIQNSFYMRMLFLDLINFSVSITGLLH